MKRECTEAYHESLKVSDVSWRLECEDHDVWYEAGLECANCKHCHSTIARQLPGPMLPGDLWSRESYAAVEALFRGAA